MLYIVHSTEFGLTRFSIIAASARFWLGVSKQSRLDSALCSLQPSTFGSLSLTSTTSNLPIFTISNLYPHLDHVKIVYIFYQAVGTYIYLFLGYYVKHKKGISDFRMRHVFLCDPSGGGSLVLFMFSFLCDPSGGRFYICGSLVLFCTYEHFYFFCPGDLTFCCCCFVSPVGILTRRDPF